MQDEAEEMMNKADKKRAEYYNYYSYKKWGAAETYHLCIDSSVLGIEATVDFIEEFVKKKLNLWKWFFCMIVVMLWMSVTFAKFIAPIMPSLTFNPLLIIKVKTQTGSQFLAYLPSATAQLTAYIDYKIIAHLYHDSVYLC